MGENFAFSNRYSRQYGLVHQGAVENLNILIAGDNEILPYLLLNLAFCGVGSMQGGCYLMNISSEVTRRHITNQFLLRPDDEGTPLVDALSARLKFFAPHFDLKEWPAGAEKRVVPDLFIILSSPEGKRDFPEFPYYCRLYGQLGPSSLFIGHEPIRIGSFVPNIFSASLASLAGAILAQDVLRLTNSLRSVDIVDQKILVSFRLKSDEIGKYLAIPETERGEHWHGIAARLTLGGEELSISQVSATENMDEGLFQVQIPTETILSRLILDSVEIIEEPLEKRGGILPPLFLSLFGDDRIEGSDLVSEAKDIPESLSELKAAIVGIGGLGTWICGLLAATPARKCELIIIDSDAAIEEHNLNRQILYSQSDIGKPKVFAALAAIKEINPAAKVHIYQIELADEILKYLKDGLSEKYHPPKKPKIFGDNAGEPLDVEQLIKKNEEMERRKKMLAGDLNSTQIYLSCLDNMRSRWILNCASWLTGRTFINGGVKGLGGLVDYIEKNEGDASLITRYGDNLKTDTGTVKCGGAIPIPAIVTTNAIIASMQSLLAVGRAMGRRPRHANYFLFDGKERIYWEHLFKENVELSDPLGINEIIG